MINFNRPLTFENASRGNKLTSFGRLIKRNGDDGKTSLGEHRYVSVKSLVAKYTSGNIIIPNFQRHRDSKIINDMMKTCEDDPAILIDCSNAIHLYECGHVYSLVDGQHRLETFRMLLEKNDEIFDDVEIIVHVLYPMEEQELLKIYKHLNYNNADINIDESSIADITTTQNYCTLKKKLKELCIDTFISSPYVQTINNFITSLMEYKFLDYYYDVDQAIIDIEERNELFMDFYNDKYDKLTESEQVTIDSGYVISLKRNNFIPFLMSDDINDFSFSHSFPNKGRKKTIAT